MFGLLHLFQFFVSAFFHVVQQSEAVVYDFCFDVCDATFLFFKIVEIGLKFIGSAIGCGWGEVFQFSEGNVLVKLDHLWIVFDELRIIGIFFLEVP